MTERTLTDRELATVLDALRYWQTMRLQTPDFMAFDDHFHDHDPLTVGKGHDEVDALCDRLNLAPTPAPVAAARTTAEETLDLLYKVAEDVSHLLTCNCSYAVVNGVGEHRCEGTCTHGMAVRALAAQLSAGAAKATSWYLVTARLAFDDEDSCYVLQAVDVEDAQRQAEADMRESADAPAQDDLPEGEEARDWYVNYVVDCGASEPVVEVGASVRAGVRQPQAKGRG